MAAQLGLQADLAAMSDRKQKLTHYRLETRTGLTYWGQLALAPEGPQV